jgi:clan AA aspartic protease
MIIGVVDVNEAFIPVVIQGVASREVTITAVLDTGFTGFLTLPLTTVEQLELPRLYRQSVTLADGSRRFVNVHGGVVI